MAWQAEPQAGNSLHRTTFFRIGDPMELNGRMAAPLPNELRSLGYPATNGSRGKPQAGNSLHRHQSSTLALISN